MVTAKTQIRIGQMVAIMQAAHNLVISLMVVGMTRLNFSDPIDYDMAWQMLTRDIVLSNALGIVLNVLFFLALVERLFKTSLCLAMVYTAGFLWALFSWEYADLGDYFSIVFKGVIIFLLFQGVIGVRRERLEPAKKVDGDEKPKDEQDNK